MNRKETGKKGTNEYPTIQNSCINPIGEPLHLKKIPNNNGFRKKKNPKMAAQYPTLATSNEKSILVPVPVLASSNACTRLPNDDIVITSVKYVQIGMYKSPFASDSTNDCEKNGQNALASLLVAVSVDKSKYSL